MRHRAPQVRRLPSTKSAAHPFQGFFPFSVLPVARSHLSLVSLHLTGYVAPLGFRTPSTLCSPRDLPGLFHPSSAPGVSPSRLCSPQNAVRPLKRRDPHAVGCQRRSYHQTANCHYQTASNANTAAPGLYSFWGSRTMTLGFSQNHSQMPPWGSAPPRFLVH